MKMPDIVVDMNRGDGGDSNQSCRGFVLPCFLFLGSHSSGSLHLRRRAKEKHWKTKTLIIPGTCSAEIHVLHHSSHILWLIWCYNVVLTCTCVLSFRFQYNVRHILSCHISAGQKRTGNNGMGKRESGETVSLFSCEYYPEMPFHTAQKRRPCRTCSILQESLFGFRRKGAAGAKPAPWAGEIKVRRTVFNVSAAQCFYLQAGK